MIFHTLHSLTRPVREQHFRSHAINKERERERATPILAFSLFCCPFFDSIFGLISHFFGKLRSKACLTLVTIPPTTGSRSLPSSRMSILQKVARALRIGKAKYIVGHDLAGNAYLELPSLSGSLDPRHTRRSIQWKEKKELGDYDQRSIPVQWVMWLRHTRREAPTIQELVRDHERILTTQANAHKLALQDKESREREQQARLEQHAEAKQRAQKLIQTTSTAMGRGGTVPTSTVLDQGVQQQAQERVKQEDVGKGARLEQERKPDEDVWAASRARLAAKGQLPGESEQGKGQAEVSASLQQAMDTRAARRAEKSQQEAESERARREMSKSPLDAFVPMPRSTK